jgi:ferredoxin-type protein NapF
MEDALDRRRFLTGRLRAPLRPPWWPDSATHACTGCAACKEACPGKVIEIIAGRPELSFATAACTFCGACAEACLEALFDKSRRPFHHLAAIGDACLARHGVVCETCRDACPEAAIRFTPRRGAPFRPEILASACTGCGACVATCPASAIAVRSPAEETDA